jgi:hypothetical protein
MNTGSSGIHKLVLPPHSHIPLDVNGAYLHIVRAIEPVFVTIDQMTECEFEAGTGTKTEEPYRYLVFRNPLPKPVYIHVWIGVTPFLSNRVDLVEATLKNTPGPAIIPANQFVELTGEPAPWALKRKSVTISNEHPSISLDLCDADGNPWGLVRSGETITHQESGHVRIRNNETEAVPVRIAEAWWKL